MAFVDILGWSDAVRDQQRVNDLSHVMLRVHSEKEMHDFATQLVGSDAGVQMSMFSDCIALSCELESKEGQGQLLRRVCRLYVALLEQGFLCRGAIVVGPAIHQGPVVFGPALLDAYQLEREWAVHPRIVVREADLRRLDFDPKRDARHVLRMGDGIPFLNPLLDWLLDAPEAIPLVRSKIATLRAEAGVRIARLKADPTPDPKRPRKIAKHEWLLTTSRKPEKCSVWRERSE